MSTLVSTEWLAERLGDRNLVILDASVHLPAAERDAVAEFFAGHIPGARFMSLDRLQEQFYPASEWRVDSDLRALGIGWGQTVVLYDNSDLRSAARAWFILRLYGVASLHVLDGGLQKWRAEGRPEEREDSSHKAITNPFTVDGIGEVRDTMHMLANVKRREEQVVDARSAARFRGEEGDFRPRVAAGHIPGSMNVPYQNVLNPDGTFKDAKAIGKAFANAGVDLDAPIVTTCGSGITASVLLLALHLIGKDGALYDGSWSVWGSDPSLPVEKGEARTRSPQHKPATRLVEAGRRREWTGVEGQPGGVVNPPVWRSSTHLYDSTADLAKGRPNADGHFYYGRRGGPTQWSLAEALTSLEPGAEGTELFPSGVAAISCTLMALLRPGDEVLFADNAYEPTRTAALGLLKRYDIKARSFDPLDVDGFAHAIGANTKLVMLENPGSLTMEICDIPALTAIARQKGVISVIDNTWASPLGFAALTHGCDVSVMSLTKHVGGHSDLMMGSTSAAKPLIERIRNHGQFLGQVVSPDDAALALRGLRTMAVRLDQSTASALAIAEWLQSRDEVASVLCPMLPGTPGYDLWQRDFTGGCGLFSFTLRDANVAERARFLDNLELFGIGFSWGGYESLAIPVDPARVRDFNAWPTVSDAGSGLGVRLSIGLEAPEDLIGDLESGFAAMDSE